MTTLYLVDNSVFQRLPHQPQVADALRSFATRGSFATCLPITLVVGHSATNGEQHARVIELINAERRGQPVEVVCRTWANLGVAKPSRTSSVGPDVQGRTTG